MPITTAAAIVAVLILTVAVPLGTMLFLRKRGGTWTAFLIGAGTFILFAMLLEQLFHRLVLFSKLGAAIQGSIWLYGLYGGLAAGLFEETGRLLAFRFALRRRPERVTSLACGVGHGGIEAFLIVGLTMVNNLALLLTYTGGGPVPDELIPSAELLLSTPAGMYLWGGFERLTAMALHMALSVLVFAAVRTGRRYLYPAAVLIHAAVDLIAVVSASALPVAATELLVLVPTVPAALWAARIYKTLPHTSEA